MIWNAITRVFPPVMQALALGVAVVGCFVERKLSSMYTPYSGSIEEQRVERQVEEELSGDPTAVPELKNFQRQYVLDLEHPDYSPCAFFRLLSCLGASNSLNKLLLMTYIVIILYLRILLCNNTDNVSVSLF